MKTMTATFTERDQIVLDFYYFLKSKKKSKIIWSAEFQHTRDYVKHYMSTHADEDFEGNTHELVINYARMHRPLFLPISNKIREAISDYVAVYLDENGAYTNESTASQPYWSVAKALERLQEQEVGLMRYIKLKVLLAT